MTEQNIDEKLYTSKEVASILRISKATLYRYHKKKSIASVCKKGRELIFAKSAIDDHLKQYPQEIQDAFKYTY